MIGTQILHYRIEAKLGEGGMGAVYLAENTHLHQRVALKFLPPQFSDDPELRARLEREAVAAAALSHPNIVTVHDLHVHEGQPFIAMEYLKGSTLSTWCKEQDPSIDDILNVAIQIGEGLKKAHEAGIVHRDLKPSNIMVDPDGRAKILDFGLAQLKGATKVTKSGSTLGTASYMSPEQSQGQKVDHRTDLWSLGVMLYEMIARRLPFAAEHEAAIAYAIAHEEPEPLARYKEGVADDLQRLVSKCLAKAPSERYQSSADVVADLHRIRRGDLASGVSASAQRSKRNRRVAVASAVAVAALLFYVLGPFEVDVGTDSQAVAAENRLAVMYFDNLVEPTDSLRTGEIVTNLIITDLSNSKHVNVVSSQRLYDILKLLGEEGVRRIDRDVATEVANRCGTRWMLLGSILQIEPEIVLTSQLVEVNSGSAIASQRIAGKAGEDVFTVVDQLTAQLRADLPLPSAEQDEEDQPVSDFTTHSVDAYRHYLAGIEQFDRGHFGDANDSFRRAIRSDSSLAMAYFWLGYYIGRGEERDRIMAKISMLLDEVTERERHYLEYLIDFRAGKLHDAAMKFRQLIELDPQDKFPCYFLGDLYSWFLEQPDSAVYYYSKAIELDSLHRMSYNQITRPYYELGDLASAIRVINKLIEHVPNEANPYDTRGELYYADGQDEKAIESFERAVALDSNLTIALRKLGDAYLSMRMYAKAEALYTRLATQARSENRAQGRLYLVKAYQHQGRFREALRRLDIGIETDRMELGVSNPSILAKMWRRAIIYYWYLSDLDGALVASDQLRNAAEQVDPSSDWIRTAEGMSARIYALRGDVTKADSIMDRYLSEIDTTVTWQVESYHQRRGHVEYAKGDFDAAIEHFRKSEKNAYLHLHLGRSYLAAGRLGDAVTHLNRALQYRKLGQALPAPESMVILHYYLGQAYERSGWKDEAIEQYETFLDIWKNADPGLESVEDAKVQLARLKTEL